MLEAEKFQGEKGLELTNLEWLIDHHKTKEQERYQTIESLDLKKGDVVLDLGCGPGLWTRLLADKVKPNGRVVGIDFSTDLINYAVRSMENDPLDKIIEFRNADFYDIPFSENTFDFVFFGNCLAYVTDYFKVLEEVKRVTKNGGRIAVKDFDGGLFIVYPMDPELSLKVLAAAAKSLKENPPEPLFDNFMGRKIHGILMEAGFKDVDTKSYAIQKLFPLIPEAKRYISGNAEWHAKIGSPYLSEEDLISWRKYFDPESDSYILDNEEFYFCMLEIMTTGTIKK